MPADIRRQPSPPRPWATLMILLATAARFHLPSAPILMILGVDALVDMGRTAFNVAGSCLAAAVVGKWDQAGAAAKGEGEAR